MSVDKHLLLEAERAFYTLAGWRICEGCNRYHHPHDMTEWYQTIRCKTCRWQFTAIGAALAKAVPCAMCENSQ